ncbi:TrkH family potassium uptake protein [Pseudarthrobacter phenanthrenivorans]|uniref:TrkH family potassium uptake protein n=1 Tax=Pseudarthrobacter phenanthrenivorans TaxID=361575 RepID=UPI001FE33EDD|nr:potassium transporter TrkG [Pseudarthrobacter phenanthrenivorans]
MTNKSMVPEARDRRGPAAALADFVDRVARYRPARLALAAYTLVALFFTLLLTLPVASADNQPTALHDAMFVAVSAVTVTGLVTVNTAEHWSFFGQAVILAAIQVGGLGIVTLAALLAKAVTRQLGVRNKLLAQQSLGVDSGRLGEVGSLLRTVIMTSLTLELVLVLFLVPRFIVVDGSWARGLWHGIFYAVSAFNNAGFVSHPDGLAGFSTDLWILIPIMVGVFVGSLGFPVYIVVRAAKWDFRKWNLHTRLTLSVSLLLFAAGSVVWGAMEWSNQDTIAGMDPGGKVLNSLFASVMMRSGGFNLVDTSASNSVTLLATDALMFAGGGSVSTGGGIKVTTLAILFLAIIAEARGNRHVTAFGRTIPEGSLRVAISVTFLGATLVLVGTGILMAITDEPMDRILFEVISGFATCGLSVGLSEELPPAGKYVLTALMLAGRVGPISFAAALALQQRDQLYRFPDERPIIG